MNFFLIGFYPPSSPFCFLFFPVNLVLIYFIIIIILLDILYLGWLFALPLLVYTKYIFVTLNLCIYGHKHNFMADQNILFHVLLMPFFLGFLHNYSLDIIYLGWLFLLPLLFEKCIFCSTKFLYIRTQTQFYGRFGKIYCFKFC